MAAHLDRDIAQAKAEDLRCQPHPRHHRDFAAALTGRVLISSDRSSSTCAQSSLATLGARFLRSCRCLHRTTRNGRRRATYQLGPPALVLLRVPPPRHLQRRREPDPRRCHGGGGDSRRDGGPDGSGEDGRADGRCGSGVHRAEGAEGECRVHDGAFEVRARVRAGISGVVVALQLR